MAGKAKPAAKLTVQDLAAVAELLAGLRLACLHCDVRGAGLAAASLLSPSGRHFRALRPELRERVEERERAMASAFLQVAAKRNLRDGASPALMMLAANFDADVGVLDG